MAQLATVQRIAALSAIPGADNIECAQVLEYNTVVQRNVFKVGDLCIWHAPDTVLPTRAEYAFAAQQQYRLRCRRIRGVVSQGLALPVSVLPPGTRTEGDDVTALVGICKYEKPAMDTDDAAAAALAFPEFLRKTDEPIVQVRKVRNTVPSSFSVHTTDVSCIADRKLNILQINKHILFITTVFMFK